MNLMQRARARMLIEHPFFATLLMTTPAVETKELPTAGTDMRKLYYNPDFIESLGAVDKVMFILAHEVMHIALAHGVRLGTRNRMLWNIACDFAINYVLVDSGLEMVEGGLYDTKYANMSADQIYEELQKMVDKARKAGRAGKPGEGDIPGLDKYHGNEGDLMEPEGAGDPASEAQMRQQIQQQVAQAATHARMAGKMPGSLEKLIGEILDPQVPWPDLLRDYMTRAAKDDESWARRNRRFQHVYMPTRYSERMGPMIFIPDTSGSMWGDDMEKICSEMAHCAMMMNPDGIKVVWADTRVAGEQDFEPSEFEFKALKPQGGGGTDMRVPLEHVEQYEPQVVVLMTDGYTPWPEVEPDYPLIVVCTTDVEVPIGSVVRIK